ncbi:MAG: hypothetical protein RLZZ165_135 [Bacteroidota bacterium]
MLRLLLLVVFGLWTIQGSAQTSTLVVFDELKEDFYLVINGERVHPSPSSHVRVNELRAGRYRVDAIFVSTDLPKVSMELALQAGREVSYALVRQGSGGAFGFAFLSEYTTGYFPVAPPDYVTVSFPGPFLDPGLPMGSPHDGPHPAPRGSLEQEAYLANSGMPVTKPNPLPSYDGAVGCPHPMEVEAFDEAKKSIAAKSFSDSKMELAKQVTKANCLLTSQVRQLMALFTFEAQRLEFAKFAYDFTYDVENYYIVNDEFGFESSIRDLARYLEGK